MTTFYPIFKDWENQVKEGYVSPWPDLPFPKKPPMSDPRYVKELERVSAIPRLGLFATDVRRSSI